MNLEAWGWPGSSNSISSKSNQLKKCGNANFQKYIYKLIMSHMFIYIFISWKYFSATITLLIIILFSLCDPTFKNGIFFVNILLNQKEKIYGRNIFLADIYGRFFQDGIVFSKCKNEELFPSSCNKWTRNPMNNK